MEREIPKIDFSGLFKTEPKQQNSAEAPKMPLETILAPKGESIPQSTKKPLEGHTEPPESKKRPQQANELYKIVSKAKADSRRSLAVYKEYQRNIKTSSQTQTAIIKGLAAGENINDLFLMACNTIALMTSDNVFYTIAKREIEKRKENSIN